MDIRDKTIAKLSVKVTKLEEELCNMTKLMEAHRSEARLTFRVNQEWAQDHHELLEHILGVRIGDLDETLHCLYQWYINR